MSEPRFVFRLTAYNTSKLHPQVSRALELCNEIVSRAKYPFLWKHKGPLGTHPVRAARQGAYDKAASKLLQGKDEFRAEDDIRISFYSEGMKTSRSYVPFTEFYAALETRDTFMLIYGPLVTVLQKRDLVQGDLGELRELFREQLPAYRDLTK